VFFEIFVVDKPSRKIRCLQVISFQDPAHSRPSKRSQLTGAKTHPAPPRFLYKQHWSKQTHVRLSGHFRCRVSIDSARQRLSKRMGVPAAHIPVAPLRKPMYCFHQSRRLVSIRIEGGSPMFSLSAWPRSECDDQLILGFVAE